MNVAHNRSPKGRLIYSELMKKCAEVNQDQVMKIDDNTYLVPSKTSPDALYRVSVDLGVCECYSGTQEAFCKHQALVPDVSVVLFRTCHRSLCKIDIL